MVAEGRNAVVLDSSDLKPCPFCGAGQTVLDTKHLSPTMRGPGTLISATVRHWCAKQPGIVGTSFSITGREVEDAIDAWNARV